ncbi:hypothetical protein IWQ54_002476 [Labrenzia sp. EL_195]|nr:hypothetical protein [Labrenzia sp. EL_195]
MIYVVTTVSGLVSALVVAVLTTTQPGNTPSIMGFTPTTTNQEWYGSLVVALYLFIWIAVGLTALLYGVMWYPGVIPTLSDIGTTWLGIAVSATYAYFGIRPKGAQTAGAPLETLRAATSSSDLNPGDKVPDASEIATCGAIKKRIARSDPEFATLVENRNANIVFKDEEGTGADRMMSARMQSKLDALAALVSKEWSDVKLRVTECWDEDGEHAADSLHYEGRAADLTTSDKDGGKLGRLAKLAIDANFDWVFYEDSSHIHVSVKS